MIIKYIQKYKQKHRLKIGILTLVVSFLQNTQGILGTWKFTLKHENFRWAFACSKLTIETLKYGVKYVQS